MGFNVITKRCIENWSTSKIYKCSNCNRTILITPLLKSCEFFEINWNNMPSVCVCGEKLLTQVTTYVPLINKVENIEI